ncbi:carboxylating nicotinate-nucleotide diphosphorylase [Candidatus Marinimicrobia bacterium]|nr:carboxylating nicotinate-nucleotide diphosphorylase [Candidatus Neomarinimicrobiota bacterium]
MIRHYQHSTLDPQLVSRKLEGFFKEDNIDFDITTISTQTNMKKTACHFIAKEDMVFAGKEIIIQAFIKSCSIDRIVSDGLKVKKGSVIANLIGPIDTILQKERVVLNLIQRLSGIASTTKTLAEKLQPHNIQLLDTRKTTPGLRVFEKFAVCTGGGINHRFSLKEAVMIKDNHLIGNPDIKDAVSKAVSANPDKDIQIEVDTVEQLYAALDTMATSVLLDNFNPEDLPEAVEIIRRSKRGSQIYIELSGGINKHNIEQYCVEGVDGISMGALTHNIQSKDISLDLK